MTETPPAPEGSVSPVAAASPRGVDQVGRRRRRVLWGAIGVVVMLSLPTGGRAAGCGGLVPALPLDRLEALLHQSRALCCRLGSERAISCLSGERLGLLRPRLGGWRLAVCASSRTSGSARCGGPRRERSRPSMSCTWVKVFISMGWAPSPSSLLTHDCTPLTKARQVDGRPRFTSISILGCTGVENGIHAEPVKASGRHRARLIQGRVCPMLRL